VTLYPFQQKCVTDALRKTLDGGRLLVVAPTGTGKSVMLSALAAAHASFGHTVAILVHRQELFDQTAAKLRDAGLTFGSIAAGREPSTSRVQLCMAQTVRRRLKGFPFDVAINDEAHRDEFGAIVKDPPRWMYGFTATPTRTDDRLYDWYGEMLEATTYSEAIAGGYIVPARCFAPHVPDLSDVALQGGDYDLEAVARKLMDIGHVGNVVENWLAKERGQKTVVFCSNVDHADKTAAEFRVRGVQCAAITGKTGGPERAFSMARFRAGSLQVLVNVGVFTEGLDVADAHVIVLDRPTHSLALYMQMCGRGGRSFPGKREYRVWDHTGSVFEHGSPTQDRQWALVPPAERKKKTAAAPGFKRCPKCFFVFAPGQTACPACATPNTTRPVKHKNGTLVEVDFEAYKPLDGFIDAYQRARRKAFAEASARGVKGNNAFALVQKSLQQTRAVMYGKHQLVIPVNTDLMW